MESHGKAVATRSIADQWGGDVSHVDWEKIKAEYLQGGTSYRKLADKHGVSFSTLRARAIKEKWADKRDEVCNKAATKVEQKIVSQRAKDIELLDRSRTLLIQKLHRSIEKLPDIPGNRMEQCMSEILLSDSDGSESQKIPKRKTVRFESDLLKMVQTLDKLMEMSGYANQAAAEADDGFIEAFNAFAEEVSADDGDIPEDS